MRLVLAALFLGTALLKWNDYGHYQAMLARYGLFPTGLTGMAAATLLVSEFALGLALLGGYQTARCLALSEGAFYLFSAAIASVLGRGLRIRCACFGVFSTRLTLWHLSATLTAAVFLSWRRKTRRPDSAGLQESNQAG